MTKQTLPPPPPLAAEREHGRFTSEVMAGGAVVEKSDDELVGGWRGAVGIAAVAALIGVLGLFSIWWLVFAVGLLIAIFLHELGHFTTARWTGMKATQFFIGFGPRLWSFRRGETEYGVRAIPAGAFVRIIGMNSMDEVEPGDEDRTYRSKSYPKRMLVISAGSLMHMLLAIVLLFAVYAIDGETVQRDGAAVAEARQNGDPTVSGAALAAGVEESDVIVAVDGVSVTSPTELGEQIRSHDPGDAITVSVLRGGATPEVAEAIELDVRLRSSLDVDGLLIGVDDVAIDQAAVDAPAVADLVAGADSAVLDEILRGYELGALVQAAVLIGDPASGDSVVQAVRARVAETSQGTRTLEGTALLGVSTETNFDTLDHSVPAAAGNAVIDIFPVSWEMTKGAVKVLNPVNIFTHLAGTNDDLSTRPTTLVGVTGISDDVGENEGVIGILYLFAVLNVFVGVFNMFPLLPLDGGHAAIASYERLRERRGGPRYYADVAKMMPFAMAVMMLLLSLFTVGLYLDTTSPIG
jgi:membrane-associated protease RseP (regulator of RpoE activity)